MKKHLEVKIFGKVQGVSFRYYTSQKAFDLAVFGYVRNESDGSVYIEAEGEEEDLKIFLVWCRKGPEAAKVEKVKFIFNEKLKKFNDFKIA